LGYGASFSNEMKVFYSNLRFSFPENVELYSKHPSLEVLLPQLVEEKAAEGRMRVLKPAQLLSISIG
jgi:hypothetical protein